MFSDHSTAVARSFQSWISVSGQYTCSMHSYKASGRLQYHVATLTGIFRPGPLSVRDTVELALQVISDQISAVERSFGARIGVPGPRTFQLHSYEASGRLQCNVATLIFMAGLLSVRDTVELSLRVFSDYRSTARSFRARIGASGPCTCRLHSYKASGRLKGKQ